MNSKQKKLLQKVHQWSKNQSVSYQLALEVDAFRNTIKRLSGLYLVQISPFAEFMQVSPKHFQTAIALDSREDAGASLIAKPSNLPFRENSIDLIGLHHSLDFYDEPHQQLREACLALVPNGYVVIQGFNPYSLWGLVKWLSKPFGGLVSDANYLSVGRIVDWLTLLDLHVESVRYHGYHWPFGGKRTRSVFSPLAGLMEKGNFPVAAGYTLIARKLVAGSTQIRPQWKKRFATGLELPSPQARAMGQTDKRNTNY